MTTRIIVTDPFKQTSKTYDVPSGGLLSNALMEISPTRWGGSAFAIYHGSISPAGEIPPEEARGIELREGEVYQVVLVPAEPISLGITIAAAVGVTSTIGIALITIAVYIAMMAVTMAISYLASMLLAPGKQSNRALSSEDQPSALNSLSPPRNLFRLGSRVTDIYGTMRFWPDLIFNAVARWDPVGWGPIPGQESYNEDPNQTSAQYVSAVYCLGRGYFNLSEFQFGDSPVSAANGAVTVYPPGVMLPSSVTGTYAVAGLSRQELGGLNSPNMWSSWYEIPNDEVSQIDVQVAFPAGLIRLYSGKKVPTGFVLSQVSEISVQGERLNPDGSVAEAIETIQSSAAKTRNELRVTYRLPVTKGRWRVRVAQVRSQPPFPNGNTETPILKTALEGIIGHRQLTDAERTFQHETVIVVNANNVGGPALQNMEAFNVLATRLLPTQDTPGVMTEPRGDGRWITAAIHTLTDPFICNYGMDEVDWESLHAVQASLDAYQAPFGESGFHAALDRQMSADEQLMLVARKARSQVFPSGGRMTFARDERRTGVSALFNRRNRLIGRGDIGMGLQFAGRDDPDGVVVSFIDSNNGYRQDTYTYPQGVTPANPLNIDLIGAVNKWEVCRRARFEMAQIQYRRRSMPLRVTEEGQLLLPYDRVAVVMPWDEGVQDGEVLEVQGLNLRLSRPAPTGMTSESRIRLRAPDGRQTNLKVVAANPALGPDWVTISSAPEFTILAPSDDRQLGTLYSISTTDATDKATHWLMTGAEIDEQGVAITLMEDADEVYQLSDDIFEPCAEDPEYQVTNTEALAGFSNSTANPQLITFAIPAARAVGSLMVLVASSRGGAFTISTAGWNVLERSEVAGNTATGPVSFLVAWRVKQAGDTALTLSRVNNTSRLSNAQLDFFETNTASSNWTFVGSVTTRGVSATDQFTANGVPSNQPGNLIVLCTASAASPFAIETGSHKQIVSNGLPYTRVPSGAAPPRTVPSSGWGFIQLTGWTRGSLAVSNNQADAIHVREAAATGAITYTLGDGNDPRVNLNHVAVVAAFADLTITIGEGSVPETFEYLHTERLSWDGSEDPLVDATDETAEADDSSEEQQFLTSTV